MKATLTRWRSNMTAETPMIPSSVPVDKPMSRRAQELRDAHYAEWADAIEQRDAALARVKASEELCAKATMNLKLLSQENTELKQRISDLTVEHKGRVISYQLERDEAVARFSTLQERCAFIEAQLAFISTQLKKVESSVVQSKDDQRPTNNLKPIDTGKKVDPMKSPPFKIGNPVGEKIK